MNLSCGDSFYNSRIADNQSSRRINDDASFQDSSGRNKQGHLIKKDDQFSISMNQFNIISDQNLKNVLKQSADNELAIIQRSQIQSEKLPNLQKIIFNLKLKMLAQRLVNQTKSRMFQNLTNYQFKLINDLSWFKYPQKNNKQNSSKSKQQQEKNKSSNSKQRYSIVDLEEDKRPNKILKIFKETLNFKECFTNILNSIDKKLPVIHPNQLFKLIWDLISMIIILILIIQIPLYISFYLKLGEILNNTMINIAPIFIVVDTFINLNSGFYEKGLLIRNILDNFNFEENELSKKMQVINLYMSKKNISKQMQYAIREYLDYYWREASERDQESEQKIISQLSDTLRENLVIEANKIVLKNSPVFRKYFSNQLKQSIVSLIKEYRCTPEELICSEGDIDDCSIFFIEKGSVEIFIETQSANQQKPDYKSLVTLKQGQSFGELSFFTGMPRSVSIRSKEFTTLLMIKRDNFIELLQNFNSDFEQFCTIKDQLLLYNDYSCINLKCYSCQSQQHLLYQCPFLHLKVNKDKIVFLHNKIEVQQRRNIVRNFRRYNFFKKKQLFDLDEIAQNVYEHNINHQNIQEYLEQYLMKYHNQVDFSPSGLHDQSRNNQIRDNFENCNINSSENQETQQQQIQKNQNTSQINNKSQNSLKEQEESQDLQSQQNKSLVYKDTKSQDEINEFDKSPIIFVKQKNNTISKIKSESSPLSPQKKSFIKLVQTQDDHNSLDQNCDINPNYPNYSSLHSVDRISPLLKKKKVSYILNSSNYDNVNQKYQNLIEQNVNEKQKSFSNLQMLNSINQNNQLKNQQNKSAKYLICQITDLLGKLSAAFNHNQDETKDLIQKIYTKNQTGLFLLPSNRQSQYIDLKNKIEQMENLSDNIIQDLFGQSLSNLDTVKNFEIYFPYNNFSYQLKLLALNKDDQKKLLNKNKIDSSYFYKAVSNSQREIGQDLGRARGSIYKSKQSSITQVVQKFQKELEDEQYQNSILLKKSKFFMNDQIDDSILSSIKKDDGYHENINNLKLNNKDKKKNQTSLVNAISKTLQDDDDASKEPSIVNKSFTCNSFHKIQQQFPVTKKDDSNLEVSISQLNQDIFNTRMQQIRTQNSNFSFDLQINQKQNNFNLNESFNIQDNSPANPINNINNNFILNQIKLKNDNELQLSIDQQM
ncbi:hypothetical protein ABPG74_010594 [Tetrahymena malaccensis]